MTEQDAVLFCGGGGVEALTPELNVTHAVEYDTEISAVYAANIGPHVTTARVQDVDYGSWGPLRYLHASPSCTRASIANPGRGETEEDVSAAAAVVRAIEACTPKAFTLENVRQYATSVGIDGGKGFKGYRMILGALERLGYMYHAEVLCAADFGVPQERYRLIVRAVRGALLPGLPPPVAWAGWLGAIEDLLPTLPDDQFAPWQIQRMPERYRTLLVGGGNTNKSKVDAHPRDAHQPAFTISGSSDRDRAFIMEGTAGGANSVVQVPIRAGDKPMFTVRPGNAARGFYAPGSNASSFRVREEAEPAPTIGDVERIGNLGRAFVVSGLNNDHNTKVSIRNEDEPYFALLASDAVRPARAYDALAGRTVRMTPRCNARFQSLPDGYKLPGDELPGTRRLAMKIVGNMAPSLMMRGIIIPLLEVVR